jgi:hypothetical protein
VAESDLRDLDHRRHTIDDDALVAPVELIRLGRREAQWHIGQLPAGIKELWPEGMRTWAAKRGKA